MSNRVGRGTTRPWMPTDQQVLLLRAALLEREPAIEAWDRWRSIIDFERIDVGSLALLPIVYRNLVDYGASDLMVKRARPTYQMTWLGNERLFYDISALLESLRAAGIETMILKGAALALLYYQDLGLRSMGDVDILIRPRDVVNAIETLIELGWKKMGHTPHVLTQTYLYTRRAINYSNNRIPKLDLHWHVMDETCRPNGDEPFWSGAIRTMVHSAETLAMNPTDQLLHVCAHETRWTSIPLPRWIVDVMTILRASGGSIDWNRFISHTQRLGLVLPVHEALKQVIDIVDAPIPSSVLDTLHRLPVSKRDERENRIRCLPPSLLRVLTQEYRRMSVQPSRYSKRWRLLAVPYYARALWGLDHVWQLPFYGLLWGVRTLRRFGRYYARKLFRRIS